jgi:hypothetical protein
MIPGIHIVYQKLKVQLVTYFPDSLEVPLLLLMISETVLCNCLAWRRQDNAQSATYPSTKQTKDAFRRLPLTHTLPLALFLSLQLTDRW